MAQSRGAYAIVTAVAHQTSARPTLETVELRPSERGLLLGMTETGKSSVADDLLRHARRKWPDQDIIIFDTKPRYRGAREVNGTGTWLRYRRWPETHGIHIPDSVVMGAGCDPKDIEWCWRQDKQVAIIQITKHDDLPWAASVMRHAYEHKRKHRKLLIDVDETNHWFRKKRANGDIIVEILTSGRENGVGMLYGGQRPRNISRESMESLTNLYWLYTPVEEDIKLLHGMGIPWSARPGGDGTHSFYFWSRHRGGHGLYRLPKPGGTPDGRGRR